MAGKALRQAKKFSCRLRPVALGSLALQDNSKCTLSFASYNIHRCIGVDGRYDPDRIAGVIRSIEADVIGLQEVDSRLPAGAGMAQLDYLASILKFKSISGPCIREDHGCYGNALLTRWPVLDVRLIDLSVPGREPRGAVDADLQIEGSTIRVVVTHLGCRAAERRAQIRRLLHFINKDRKERTVIMGDFNEWSPLSRGLRAIHWHLGSTSAKGTFPSRFPVLRLDHLGFGGGREAALARPYFPCRPYRLRPSADLRYDPV